MAYKFHSKKANNRCYKIRGPTKTPCPLDDDKRYITLDVGSDIHYSRTMW